MIVKTGDIGLTRSFSRLANLIVSRTTDKWLGEPPSRVNHALTIVTSSLLDWAVSVLQQQPDPSKQDVKAMQVALRALAMHKGAKAFSIEALARGVVCRPFPECYAGSGIKVAIYRDSTLSGSEERMVALQTVRKLGSRYAWLKLPAISIDHHLSNLFRRKVRFARKLFFTGDDFCSLVVSEVRAMTGRFFGVRPGEATPDDLDDYILAHPEQYEEVHPLEEISG